MYHLQVEEGQLQLTAGAKGAEVILLSAKPLKEPVYFHGPFVASSPAQIQEVFEAYHSGRMGQLDGLPG
jgi:redox-sensitive bicupin YhaK (pirin superfamily)